MMRLRGLVLVLLISATAACGSLVTAALLGMKASEVTHLAAMFVPAILATVASAAVAGPLLSKSPVRHRLLALSLVTVVVSLANLAVLSALMMLKHEVLLVASLVVYSAGAGLGAAWSLSRSFSKSMHQITQAASALGEGNLATRIGSVDAGPELQRLASSLDEMAGRLERSIQSEQTAIRIRDDLITAVSHDLRTPLAGLRAMVEAMNDGVVRDRETIERYLKQMKQSVGTLSLLLDDLFELVKLDVKAVLEETKRASIIEVIASGRDACETQASEKGLSIEIDIDHIDSGVCSPRLARVVQNLLQNAIRHTPPDGTVRLGARRIPGALELWVHDSGPGIPEDAKDKIFEPFWRGDAARTSSGSGLGLALAKRIVEALGGEIRVDPSAEAGARLAVVIPEAN